MSEFYLDKNQQKEVTSLAQQTHHPNVEPAKKCSQKSIYNQSD